MKQKPFYASARLTKELFERLKAAAQAEQRTVSQIIEFALRHYFKLLDRREKG